MKTCLASFCLLFVCATSLAQSEKKNYPEIDIAYKKFVLDNGLTLVVHEDHKAPIAALNVWYHVGSKNEPVGKNGFAHLFEHLMFTGSKNNRDKFDVLIESIGAIPASPPIARQNAWVPKMSGIHYQTAQDHVPQARVQKTWNTPQWGTADDAYLNLLSDILTNGKTSRLYKRLVYDDQLSNNVYSYVDDREIASQFNIFCYENLATQRVK